MQANKDSIVIIGIITAINMLTLGFLGLPIGFFTGNMLKTIRNGVFIGTVVGLSTVVPFVHFSGGAQLSLERNIPAALGSLMADGVLMWVSILTGGFFDAWSFSVILKQLVTSVAAGALLGCPLALAMLSSRKRSNDNIKAI